MKKEQLPKVICPKFGKVIPLTEDELLTKSIIVCPYCKEEHIVTPIDSSKN